jgi:hypothetical protein
VIVMTIMTMMIRWWWCVHGLVVCVHIVLKAISDNRPPAWLAHMYDSLRTTTVVCQKTENRIKNKVRAARDAGMGRDCFERSRACAPRGRVRSPFAASLGNMLHHECCTELIHAWDALHDTHQWTHPY